MFIVVEVFSFKAVPVLVTGAGRGIGKRLAIGFAQKGARVGLVARSKPELDLCHLEIQHAGGSALRIRADVRDQEEVQAAAERMRAHFGSPVQVLVCAAGVLGPIGPFMHSSAKHWKDVIDTNILGVLNACRAVLPTMAERRSGKIIIVSGVGGPTPARPNFAVMSATKTGMVRFAESLADEVAEHNVQVNCLSPGETYTHQTDQILAAPDRAGWREVEKAREIRMTGGANADKQIELAQFLASEHSNHITGRMFHVDDQWKKLMKKELAPELFRLRRVQRL